MAVERIDEARAGIELSRRFASLVRDALGSKVMRITLFGSRARGDARQWSDYDVLVVVSEKNHGVREAVLDASVEMMNQHETLFASLLYDEEEWDRARRFPIGWRIGQEGIDL